MTGTCNFLAPWKNTWLSEREGPIIARPSCCNIFFSTILFSSVAWQSAWSVSQEQAGVSEYLNSGRTVTSQSSCLEYFFHIKNHTHLDMKKRAKMARLYKKYPSQLIGWKNPNFWNPGCLGKNLPASAGSPNLHTETLVGRQCTKPGFHQADAALCVPRDERAGGGQAWGSGPHA